MTGTPPDGVRMLGRRQLLAALGGTSISLALAALAGVPASAHTQTRPALPKPSLIGRSQGSRPIHSFAFGGDRRRVLVLGGQHGSPEANAVSLADAVLEYIAQHRSTLPKNVGLDVITIANPDGFVEGSRQYLSGVDPNRNWASPDWSPDAYDSLGQFWSGLGGKIPMSEPETRALASWITRRRHVLVVNYHSAGGFVSTGQTGRSWELASAYAEASGYPCFGPDRPPFGYTITGAMDGWQDGASPTSSWSSRRPRTPRSRRTWPGC